jgi:RNA polymerase sigma-70 factor (ECF subfamily)
MEIMQTGAIPAGRKPRMSQDEFPKPLQAELNPAWNRYVDVLAPHRPALHRYCVQLAGNLWDGEDLVQDTLVRVFAMLGKRWASIEKPAAYLARVATNLWIDRARRRELERAFAAREREAGAPPADPGAADDVRAAAGSLLARLTPRERAAVLMKDVLDLSVEETAGVLRTSIPAVKAALHRGRGRLAEDPPAAPVAAAPRELVDRFVAAFNAHDLAALREIVSEDVRIELVGGNEMHGAADGEGFFAHALGRFPGDERGPRFEALDTRGERIVLGFRVWDGVEGLNDASRLEASEGRVDAIRCYCWCPDTLRVLAAEIGVPANPRPYRSPTLEEFQAVLASRSR